MQKKMSIMHYGIGLLIALSMVFCTMIPTVTADETHFPCLTECQLDHDHATEICEIDHRGRFLNWSEIPSVWEFNWNNTQACWDYGMWYNGCKFTTPQGEFDIDVRNKIAMHSDGEYLYLDVMKATVAGPGGINGYGIQITVDGQMTQFQLLTSSGGGLADLSTPGTHTLLLKHEMNAVSGQAVAGSEGYAYINDTKHNSEFELKIPLAAFKTQNPNVDLDNLNEISFKSLHIMSNPLTITGISTYPYALAALCIAGVGFAVYKMARQKRGDTV